MNKLAMTVAGLATLATFAHSQVNWERDLNNAMKKAKATKRLIFVDFYADW